MPELNIDPELPAAPLRTPGPAPELRGARTPLEQTCGHRLLERLSGRGKLEQIYREVKAEPFDLGNFFTRALELSAIETEFTTGEVRGIPVTGPLIFFGNHPYGLIDGMIMCRLAAHTRGEFRILLHARLCQDPDLAPYFLPVDFEETKAAVRANIATKRAALDTLRRDGTLIIFPGGGVATAPGGFGIARELPWSTFVAKLIHQSHATRCRCSSMPEQPAVPHRKCSQ